MRRCGNILIYNYKNIKKTVTLDLKEYENLKNKTSKINEANLEIIKEKDKEIKELNKIIQNDYITDFIFCNIFYYKKSEGIYEIEKELKEKYEKQIIELKAEAKRSDIFIKTIAILFLIYAVLNIYNIYNLI